MMHTKILWSQKANDRKNTWTQLGYFLYEFIGGRFTIFAFIGLLNLLAYHYKYFVQILSGGIAIVLFYLIKDAFNVFWTGLNLRYLISEDEIIFEWGKFKTRNLVIPIDNITKITILNSKNRKAIILENVDKFNNGDFGFSKEAYFNILSFENVKDIENVTRILKEVYFGPINEINHTHLIEWSERLPTSSLYMKTLQLIAFILLYIATSIGIKLIDNNILPTTTMSDLVVSQPYIRYGRDYYESTLITKLGYEIEMVRNVNYVGEVVEFELSPIYKDITYFHNIKSPNYQSLKNRNQGTYGFLKLCGVFIMLISGSYIFYKRGHVPFDELGVLVIFPILFLIISFVLFA